MPTAASASAAAPAARTHGAPYGFLSIHSGLFPAGIHGDLNDLGPQGEALTVDERKAKCAEREEAKFDPGQYQCVPLPAARLSHRTRAHGADALFVSAAGLPSRRGDFVYDDEIKELIRWQAPWAKAAAAEKQADDDFFTEAEKAALASLETKDTREPCRARLAPSGPPCRR